MNRKDRRIKAKKLKQQTRQPAGNGLSSSVNSVSKTSVSDHNRIVEAALVHHKKGDITYANQVYRKVLQENPRHALALHYLGLIAQQTGHPKEAAQLIQESIKEDPTDPRAYNHLGQVYLYMGDKTRTMQCFKKALQIDPDHVDSLNNYANQLVDQKEYEQAIALYRRVVKLNGNVSHSPYNLAKTLKEVRAFDEAIEWYKRTLQIDPDHVPASHSLGLIHEEMGDFDAAVDQYQKTLLIKPGHIKALSNLLAIKSFRPSKDDVAKAEQILKAPKLDAADTAKMCHGLGKHYDRAEEYGAAFAHFAKSNEAQRALAKPYKREKITRFYDQSIQLLNEEYFEKVKDLGSASSQPIFVVGLPRSGTTMTEQILASHPDVFGAGELLKIPHIYSRMLPNFPQDLLACDKKRVLEMAQVYLDYIHDFSPAGVKHITDKLPMNFMHLGLIATLFPNAKVVYCRRNPMDVGLSCFIEMFHNDNDFSLKQEDFGFYFLEQERIRQHWLKVLPIPVYTQKYEELVADQEKHTRELINFCGLEWDDACLSFHETERMINTPSRWQVRQPMYTSSAGRWKNYEKHLQPLQTMLVDYKY